MMLANGNQVQNECRNQTLLAETSSTSLSSFSTSVCSFNLLASLMFFAALTCKNDMYWHKQAEYVAGILGDTARKAAVMLTEVSRDCLR